MSSFPPPDAGEPRADGTDPWDSVWRPPDEAGGAYPRPPRSRRHRLAVAGVVALTAFAVIAAAVLATVLIRGGLGSSPADSAASAGGPTPGNGVPGAASSKGPGGTSAAADQADQADQDDQGDGAGATGPIPVPIGKLGDVTTFPRGTCFDYPPDDAADTEGLTHICSEPHDAEVYAVYRLAAGRWPGDLRVQKAADSGCEEAFRSYVGTSYEDSDLEYSSFSPTKELWKAGDRRVSCVLEDPADELTGSAHRSKR